MDRSLWLLIKLRGWAWLRHWGRNLRTLKGTLLALVGSLLFLPTIGFALLAPRVQTAAQLDAIRLYGPLALLGYCVLNVLLSSGDRAVYYSPAEISFLFCGPFRPRQLLLYKVAVGVSAGLVTALFMAIAFTPHSARFISSYVALFLTLELIYLFSMGVGLVISTFGTLAFSRGRKLVLTGLVLVVVGALTSLGRQLLTATPAEIVDRALRSAWVTAVTTPFRPFVMAYASEKLWPDLVGWSSLAAAVDIALLAVVLGLNARFVEASAAASARIYDRIRKARRGEAWVGGELKSRAKIPMLPRWGGIGPNLWRQATTAVRSPSRVATMLLLLVLPVALTLLVGRGDVSGRSTLTAVLPVFLGITFIASSAVGFDFRPDLGRMEDLKTLPIRPTRLVIGQLITPVLILSIGQWLTLGVIVLLAHPEPELMIAGAALVVPANFLFVAIENLYFLWFPYRAVGINSFDFQAMGRQLLLMGAKVATVGLVAGVAGGLGALVYYVTSPAWIPALITTWLAAGICGLGLVPLVALAFEGFDVASDRAD